MFVGSVRVRSLSLFLIASLAFVGDASRVFSQEEKSAEVINYKEHIAPIFRKRCGSCHGADQPKSDLTLVTYQGATAGGSSGAAITPGSPDQSRLYRLVSHQEEPVMPPRQPKLPDNELALIAKWIERGAPETAVSAVRMATRKTEINLADLASDREPGSGAMPESLPEIEYAKTLRGAAVTAMETSPWAPLVAVSGHECVQFYHTDTREFLGAVPFPEGIVHVLRFSQNGDLLMVAGGRGAEQGVVVLFDVRTGKRVAEIGDEADSILAADLSPDQSMVAIGGSDKLVKVFSVQTGEQLYQIKKHTDWVTALEFSPDGNYLASGDRNGGAFIWEADRGTILFTLGDHKDMITQVSWRSDSQMLATASEDGRVILWLSEDGFPARSITPHTLPNNSSPNLKQKTPGVLSVRFARNGNFATVGRDLTSKSWSNTGSRTDATVDGFSHLPSRAALDHTGTKLLAGDLVGNVRVWNIKDKALEGEFSTAR